MKTFFLVLFLVNLFIKSSFAEDVFISSSIKEASGIVYHDTRGSLFVVDDEGLIFEITTNGKILNQKFLGDFDFEGVTLGQDDDELIVAVEGNDNLLFVNESTLSIIREVSINRRWNGVKILKKDKKHGIEGIHNFDGKIFLVNQSYNLNPQNNPKDPSMIFEVREDKQEGEFYIYSVIYFPFPDLAGISSKDGLFYLVSDDEDLILVYDMKGNEVIEQIDIPSSGDHEGITFDKDGYMYIAIDGKGILKTKISEINK